MMATILTLMITAMIFQGVMAVIDSVLDMVGVNSMIKGIPVIISIDKKYAALEKKVKIDLFL